MSQMLIARQRKILEIIAANELATVDELCAELSVSEATVRRDLAALEAEGLVNRTWGGAVPVSSVAYGLYVHERSQENLREKQMIVRAAADLIHEGEVIALDGGTTCMELAKQLRRFQRITVFTNSLLAAHILGNCSVTVHVIGGRLRSGEFSMVGNVARDTILRLHFDTFFMGASGFDLENGPTDFNLDDVEIKQCFLRQSRERVALVDHSKFGRTSLASICNVEDLTYLVSDPGISQDHIAALQSKGLTVLVGKDD